MRLKTIAATTAIAGTLDIVAATAMTVGRGGSAVQMLQGIASGPFGSWAAEASSLGVAVGLAVHFILMALMVLAFVFSIAQTRLVNYPLAVVGPAFGAALYIVMYWLVLPARWPSIYPQTGAVDILLPLAIHIVVGFVIAAMIGRGGVQHQRDAFQIALDDKQ